LLGGFIALLTPCVFPLIPLTVSFFTKKTNDRKKGKMNALLYGFFIFLIYTLFSIPFHLLSNVNPEILNNISTNVWLNLIFFAIFIVFAISFFGYFEIVIPGGIANRIDSKSGMGTVGGIFFMALTLAIVSFSCTGPILGSLLVGTAAEGAWPLTAGLAGFGLALACHLHCLPCSPDGFIRCLRVVDGSLQ
jgi:thiol:disulfide interchange protein DsbD